MKKKKIHINPDPSKYIIVATKEGDKLRGKRLDPYINEALTVMAKETCSGAAKRIRQKLHPFTAKMEGRVSGRLSGKMRTANWLTGVYDYSQLQGFEFLQEYPLDGLYKGQYQVHKEKQTLYVEVPVSKSCMKAHNRLVSQYYFEVIALYGDAMLPDSLRIEDEQSPLFDFGKSYKKTLRFSFVLPQKTPYLIWLKAGCMEGREAAHHPRHYGMRVVAVG